MDRRAFLLLRTTRARETELSCERLYMRYVDAAADGTISELVGMLRADLAQTRRVRVTHREWLAMGNLERRVARILSDFAAAGGEVI